MPNCVVYQVTNTFNGKRYIGYTSSMLEDRWKGHLKRARLGSKTHFHSAIRKHGQEVFVREVLFEEESAEGAKETEILLILDRQPEYNKTFGGDGTPGHPVTDETREKIRQNTPVRKGQDHPLFGKSRPDNIERNKSRKGIKNPKCARKGESNHWFGTGGPMLGKTGDLCPSTGLVRSEETKAKQSASAKLRARTEEGKANARAAGRKGAEVRWAKHRAAKLAAQNSEDNPSE